MKTLELINDLLDKNKGIITTEEVIHSGVSKPAFYAMVRELGLKKAAHGIYTDDVNNIDDKYILQLKYPRAVISHDSAAFIHGLLPSGPDRLAVTLNTGINPGRLTQNGIKVYTIKEELLELGKITIYDEYGQYINVYNIERTVCDIVRCRNKLGSDVVSKVMKAYAGQRDRDIVKLMLYAKSFRVRNIIREYMEILL